MLNEASNITFLDDSPLDVVSVTHDMVALYEKPRGNICCRLRKGVFVEVLERKMVNSILWVKTPAGWLCSIEGDEQGSFMSHITCFVDADAKIARDSWQEEEQRRKRMASAVTSMIVQSHPLPKAKRLVRTLLKHAETYYPDKPMVKVAKKGLEDVMITLAGKHGLGKQDLFEYIKIAAAQQSNPPQAVLEIVAEIHKLIQYRPTEWVTYDMNVLVTEDVKRNNDKFIGLASLGKVEEFQAMVERGHELTCLHSELRYTALHGAADFGQVNVVDYIIRTGASLDMKDPRNGQTALHIAAYNGRAGVIKSLLAANADRCIGDNFNYLPYEYADRQGHVECRELLKYLPPHPRNLKVSTFTISSITVEWSPPILNMMHHSDILEYFLDCLPTVDPNLPMDYITEKYVSADSQKCSVRFTNLLPCSQYSIRAKCRSLSGWSEFGPAVSQITLKYVPDAPDPIEIIKVSTNGLLLSWHRPLRDNGLAVNFYQVELIDCKRMMAAAAAATATSAALMDPSASVHVSTVTADPSTAKTSGSGPERVRLEAGEEEEEEEEGITNSKSIADATADGDAGGVDKSYVTSATLPAQMRGNNRRLSNSENQGGLSKFHRLIRHKNVHHLSKYLTGLEPLRMYQCRVRAYNDLGFSPWSGWTGPVCPKAGVTITSFTPEELTATLSWFEPLLSRGRTVQAYEFQLCCMKGPLFKGVTLLTSEGYEGRAAAVASGGSVGSGSQGSSDTRQLRGHRRGGGGGASSDDGDDDDSLAWIPLSVADSDASNDYEKSNLLVTEQRTKEDLANEFITLTNTLTENVYKVTGLKAGSRYKCRVRCKVLEDSDWIPWENALMSNIFSMPATPPDPPFMVRAAKMTNTNDEDEEDGDGAGEGDDENSSDSDDGERDAGTADDRNNELNLENKSANRMKTTRERVAAVPKGAITGITAEGVRASTGPGGECVKQDYDAVAEAEAALLLEAQRKAAEEAAAAATAAAMSDMDSDDDEEDGYYYNRRVSTKSRDSLSQKKSTTGSGSNKHGSARGGNFTQNEDENSVMGADLNNPCDKESLDVLAVSVTSSMIARQTDLDIKPGGFDSPVKPPHRYINKITSHTSVGIGTAKNSGTISSTAVTPTGGGMITLGATTSATSWIGQDSEIQGGGGGGAVNDSSYLTQHPQESMQDSKNEPQQQQSYEEEDEALKRIQFSTQRLSEADTQLLDIRHDSITINWQNGQSNGLPIEGFRIECARVRTYRLKDVVFARDAYQIALDHDAGEEEEEAEEDDSAVKEDSFVVSGKPPHSEMEIEAAAPSDGFVGMGTSTLGSLQLGMSETIAEQPIEEDKEEEEEEEEEEQGREDGYRLGTYSGYCDDDHQGNTNNYDDNVPIGAVVEASESSPFKSHTQPQQNSYMTKSTGNLDLWQWEDITDGGKFLGSQRFRAENLLPGSTYIFRVKQQNSCGWSTFSGASRMIATYPSVPPGRPEPFVIRSTYTAVRWRECEQVGIGLTNLEYQVQLGVVLPQLGKQPRPPQSILVATSPQQRQTKTKKGKLASGKLQSNEDEDDSRTNNSHNIYDNVGSQEEDEEDTTSRSEDIQQRAYALKDGEQNLEQDKVPALQDKIQEETESVQFTTKWSTVPVRFLADHDPLLAALWKESEQEHMRNTAATAAAPTAMSTSMEEEDQGRGGAEAFSAASATTCTSPTMSIATAASTPLLAQNNYNNNNNNNNNSNDGVPGSNASSPCAEKEAAADGRAVEVAEMDNASAANHSTEMSSVAPATNKFVHVMLNNLVAGTNYVLRVRVRTVMGWSPWTEHSQLFRTKI